jgi:hypothetical protein
VNRFDGRNHPTDVSDSDNNNNSYTRKAALSHPSADGALRTTGRLFPPLKLLTIKQGFFSFFLFRYFIFRFKQCDGFPLGFRVPLASSKAQLTQRSQPQHKRETLSSNNSSVPICSSSGSSSIKYE